VIAVIYIITTTTTVIINLAPHQTNNLITCITRTTTTYTYFDHQKGSTHHDHPLPSDIPPNQLINTQLIIMSTTTTTTTPTPRKIWIDCDPGHDDAMALLLALYLKEQVQVVGISTVSASVRG
jgi:hypothetical protein